MRSEALMIIGARILAHQIVQVLSLLPGGDDRNIIPTTNQTCLQEDTVLICGDTSEGARLERTEIPPTNPKPVMRWTGTRILIGFSLYLWLCPLP